MKLVHDLYHANVHGYFFGTTIIKQKIMGEIMYVANYDPIVIKIYNNILQKMSINLILWRRPKL